MKIGEIEPAFDYWRGPLKKLREQRCKIMDFEEWVAPLERYDNVGIVALAETSHAQQDFASLGSSFPDLAKNGIDIS